MKSKKLILLLAVSQILLCTQAQENLDFEKDKWDIITGKISQIGDRKAFTGTALLKDVQFRNGVIEWDLWASGGRSYAGVIFHHQPNRNSEEFYIRPHKANGLNADAFQYTPVYHGVSCWQLFHGKDRTRPAIMPANQWVHFKLIVKDGNAIISMGEKQEVSMYIPDLDLGDIQGRIGLKGPADGSAWFSNFKYSDEITNDLPVSGPQHSNAPGTIYDWEISKPITNDKADPYRYYPDDMDWEKIVANKAGLVNLTRAVTRNLIQPGWLYARTIIESPENSLRKFQLGYSDYVTVFVNGVPVFSGTNAYTSRDPGYQGLIGYFDELFLPLKKGSNEIALLSGEQFGGWGFMMRDGEAVKMADGMKKLWELKYKLNYPESVVFDPATNMLYASNYLNNTGGGICKISLDGEIIDANWVSGLRQPTGICISNDMIYVVERGGLVKIDKSNGKILERIALEGSVFPNDVTAVPDQDILFVTDNETNRIYSIEGGKSYVWIEGGELIKPNGIEYSDGKLICGCTGGPALKSIDINTKKVETLINLPEGSIMDGIQMGTDGEILFSDFNGHLFRLTSEGKSEEILNTVSTQASLADFEFIPELNMIIIPGLYSNILSAYTLK